MRTGDRKREGKIIGERIVNGGGDGKRVRAARELHKLVKTDNYRCLALLLQPPVDHGLAEKAAVRSRASSSSLNVFVGFPRYGR